MGMAFVPFWHHVNDDHTKGDIVVTDLNPHIITLGTAGGPRWWTRRADAPVRSGIATAVVVGGAVYVVDLGRGAMGQFAAAGLAMADLRAVFLTHLHSDHTVDLAGLLQFGWMMDNRPRTAPVQILGPGDRGALPPLSRRAEPGSVTPPFADNPTPGTRDLVLGTLRANGTDIADRMFDALRRSPLDTFEPADIAIPAGVGYHPNDNNCPEGMEPFEVYRDELVTVTAILVEHAPVAPAFAFRFDTEQGSVTISGDTAPCGTMVRLARDTDLLLHEAIDLDVDTSWLDASYGDADAGTRQSTIDHHRASHTTALAAGQIAADAGARSLALHHLVPGNAARRSWEPAAQTYSGPLFVPDDLETISFARAPLGA